MKKRIPKISNEELKLEKIPDPEDQSSDDQEVWGEFALTMNAYEVCGDSAFELAGNVLKDLLNASLTDLRCALFVLQRHHRWNSPYSDGDNDERVIQLLKLIRDKVEKGELE